jgi:hypothetical protein
MLQILAKADLVYHGQELRSAMLAGEQPEPRLVLPQQLLLRLQHVPSLALPQDFLSGSCLALLLLVPRQSPLVALQ